MDSSRWMVRAACAMGVVGALAAVTTVARADPAQAAAPVRAQEIVGRKVLDGDGRETGWVEDLVVDPGRGAVVGLVVAHDGRSVRLPVEGARYEDGKVHVRAADKEIDRLSRWKAPAEPALRRATKLIGQPLRARDGASTIATVKDLLVDIPSARVTHVVLEFDPSVKQQQGWVAVASNLVQADGDQLRAAFDPRNLHDAQARARQAQAPARRAELEGRDARLSRLPGRLVKGVDDAELGQVTGALVDVRARRIAALLIDHGFDEYTCAVGKGALTIGRNEVRAPAGAGSLADVHGCSRGLRDPGGDVLRGRELLQARFHDPRGNEVGRLAEVVVKADDGAFHYYVGDFNANWVQDGKLVGLPLRGVQRVDGGLVLEAHLMEMMHHPVFDEKRLEDVWSPAFAKGMDKYLGASR